MDDRSSQTSRQMSPLPKPSNMLPRPRFRDIHPHLYGGLIGSALTIPAVALYSYYRKPINKFVSNVGKGISKALCAATKGLGIGNLGNYAKRMTQNALSAMWNTPFKEKIDSSAISVSNKERRTTSATQRVSPNPTPRASSENEKYDRNHKNTINEKH